MGFVAAVVNGETVMLEKMRVRDLIELGELRHSQARAALLADMDAVGADPAMKLGELATLQRQRDFCGLIVAYAMTSAGAAEIVRRAATRKGLAPDDVLAPLNVETLPRLALELIDAKLPEEPDERDEGDEDPTAARPAT
jgi:hypothetical protein